MDREQGGGTSSAGVPELVFVSYSHADRKWVDRLRVHLKPLERHGAVTLWDDSRIRPGSQWKTEIRQAIDRARVAILIVSADFLASDFITTNELPPLLHAARDRGTVILSLIVKPCRFEQTSEIAEFQAINSPSQPLAQLRSTGQDQLFVKLAGEIEEILKRQRDLAEKPHVEARASRRSGSPPTRERIVAQSAEFNEYLIQILDDGTVEVESRGRPVKPSKPALRSIAGILGLSLLNGSGNPMNTRQLGARIVVYLHHRGHGHRPAAHRVTVGHEAGPDSSSTTQPSMLGWLGSDGDRIAAAWRRVFGEDARPFGSATLGWGGLSDGNEGVQWNAGFDPRAGERWIGVNLEGMKYDGWPVARLITRELSRPLLHDHIERMRDTAGIRVIWTRDYWQATSRPRILEKYIEPTPILLDALTPGAWRQALSGARECLEFHGREVRRGTQLVTLAATGRGVEGPVSPHLTFRLSADSITTWEEFFREGKARLQPLYEWTEVRSTP